MPMIGHGFGLSWQKRWNAAASFFRQDGEVALDETAGDPGGARRHAGAAGMAGRDARQQISRHAIRDWFRPCQAGHR
jgi:hypothetical protein